MDRKERQNPFKEGRISLISAKPLLTYGEKEFTLFKRLGKNKRLYTSQVVPNDRQVQQELLWRYERQYYATDQNGRSYAEQVFNHKIQQKKQQKDFWQKIGSQSKKLTKQNSFLHSEASSKKSLTTYSTIQNNPLGENVSNKKTALKSPRNTNRQQINKIRKTLKQCKGLQQAKSLDNKKFSVMGMYKAKKAQDNFQPFFTFAQTYPDFQIKVIQPAQIPQVAQVQYPKSISVGNELYYFIPFG